MADFITHPHKHMLTKLLPMLQEAGSTSIEYSAKGDVGTVPPLIALAFLVLMIAAVW